MNKTNSMNRRQFIDRSLHTALSLGAVTSLSAGRVLGANERIGLGVIGSGGRGQAVMKYFQDQSVSIRAICDVYEPNLQAGLKQAGPEAKSYDHYRELLQDKDLDAVIIATPDHWHAQMAIDAVEAGKDVYLEKPFAHGIEEGFRVVEAVKRTNRVVQVGTQRRSWDFFREGKKIMDSGKLGEVRLVIAWWLNHWPPIRAAQLQGKLDWDQWLGPAPRRPLDTVRFFNWLYFYDYSGGIMVGQGAHVIDAIQWFLNSTYPTAVTCSGGDVHLKGVEIPETTVMNVEFPEDYLATFTVGYKAMHYTLNNDQMKQFHGSKARFDMARESYALYPESDEVVMKPEMEKKQFGTFSNATRDHVINFLDCLRNRQAPNATVEMGQCTNVVLCMAVESLRKGLRVRWDKEKRQMVI